VEVKQLIKEELKHAQYERQLKFRARISESVLLRLGAKEFGTTTHEDHYYRSKRGTQSAEMIRVRVEGGERLLFTYRDGVRRSNGRVAVHKLLGTAHLRALELDHEQVLTVHKRRTVYLYKNIIINVDDVERLGSFVEIEIKNNKDWPAAQTLLAKLQLHERDALSLTYFELALRNFAPHERLLAALHERFGSYVFGISSAVLTTLGIVVGINAATSSRTAIIAGIVGVAVAESCSDAFSMYSLKRSERGVSTRAALRGAIATWLAKATFALTFIIPFLLLDFSPALITSLVWGVALLTFVNIQIAFVQQTPIARTVARNILFAFAVIALSYYAGTFVAMLE